MQVIEILLYIFSSFSIDVISYILVDLGKQQANLTAVSPRTFIPTVGNGAVYGRKRL